MSRAACVMEGSLDEYDLVHVVQTIGAARHPANLELFDADDELVGSIQLEGGHIVAARAQELTGLEAVRRLLKTPRPRHFYVYRAAPSSAEEQVGPISLVLAQVLTQSVPPTPEATPILLQGNLAEVNLRDVAAAVSLGRTCVGIEVFAPDGRRVGALYLRGGKVLFAVWGRSGGEQALRELLRPRRDGRFVMFRSSDAGVGDPIADLSEFLRPKLRPASSASRARDLSHVVDEDNGETDLDDDVQVTLVAPPRSRAQAFSEGGAHTGTRQVARKSFPPPSEAPRAPSEVPRAPRFRHSERPSAAPDAGSILLSELGYGPRAAAPVHGPKIIAVTSPRGGAGRTTVALNLALALGRRGKRVVLIDADANGLLPAVRAPERVYAGVAEVLADEIDLDSALLDTRAEGLWLLPSGELSESAWQHPEWPRLLGQLGARFDVVLVDCAPVLYGATLSVMGGATHYLMVVAAEPAALSSCQAFQTRLAATLPKPPALLGIVLNMLDYQVRASVHALEQLSASSLASAVFDIPIPRSPAFMEASAQGAPIAHTETGAPRTIAWVFEALAAAVLERLDLAAPARASEPLLT